ncbi:hypothetical protein, partial [Natrialba sp. PRR66]|uniref:hypothetical protein n=1 Tax=Natrialba sp. PRR66 TaxID=3098146 RepID=UPI002B1DAD28
MSRDRLTRPIGTARRNVMKALGAGAALGALGWSTLGAGGGDTGGTSTVTDLDEHTGTVHDVQTLISGPPS